MSKTENKKSFLLHKDSLNVLDELTDEQAGKLFKAIKNYQNGIDTKLDFGLKMAFLPFKNQFIRDLEKYKDQCGTNSKNGKLGGRPKKAKESEKSESVILKAKKADSDNDSDSDTVSDSVSKNDKYFIINGNEIVNENPVDYYLKNNTLVFEAKLMQNELSKEKDKIILGLRNKYINGSNFNDYKHLANCMNKFINDYKINPIYISQIPAEENEWHSNRK